MKLTFAPRSRNRYACNQTGHVMSKNALPGYRNAFLGGGDLAAAGYLSNRHKRPSIRSSKPKARHGSKYRNKHM
ncbi:hypothetical protein KC902_03880 [Candidatus Kaiserbacteria bacterium]|nr:hypothetical protein [Candidatus Kaiserbacteria bacterium]USN88431.1 MAG: hypothetical protein H6780_02970 [Candidatus Nomurabacteria bacterium]